MSLLRDISLDIEAPLGAGGMAEVYKARDTRLDSCLTVKVQPERGC